MSDAERIAQAIEAFADECSREYEPSECDDAAEGYCHRDAAQFAYAMAARIARDTPTPAAVTGDTNNEGGARNGD